jgi:hypothetical protein
MLFSYTDAFEAGAGSIGNPLPTTSATVLDYLDSRAAFAAGVQLQTLNLTVNGTPVGGGIGSITPSFGSAHFSYEVILPAGTTSLSVQTTFNGTRVRAQIGSQSLVTGGPAFGVGLANGENRFSIEVYDLTNNSLHTTYNLVVYVGSSANSDTLTMLTGIQLGGSVSGWLSASCQSALGAGYSGSITGYSCTYDPSTSSTYFTPTLRNTQQTITMDGNNVTNGLQLPLQLTTAQDINLVVSHPNATQARTYTITLTPTNIANNTALVSWEVRKLGSIESACFWSTMDLVAETASNPDTCWVLNPQADVLLYAESAQPSATVNFTSVGGTSSLGEGSFVLSGLAESLDRMIELDVINNGNSAEHHLVVRRLPMLEFTLLSDSTMLHEGSTTGMNLYAQIHMNGAPFQTPVEIAITPSWVGTAMFNTDYTVSSSTIHFPAGSVASQTITLAPNPSADAFFSGDRWLVAKGTSSDLPAGYVSTLGDTLLQVRIREANNGPGLGLRRGLRDTLFSYDPANPTFSRRQLLEFPNNDRLLQAVWAAGGSKIFALVQTGTSTEIRSWYASTMAPFSSWTQLGGQSFLQMRSDGNNGDTLLVLSEQTLMSRFLLLDPTNPTASLSQIWTNGPQMLSFDWSGDSLSFLERGVMTGHKLMRVPLTPGTGPDWLLATQIYQFGMGDDVDNLAEGRDVNNRPTWLVTEQSTGTVHRIYWNVAGAQWTFANLAGGSGYQRCNWPGFAQTSGDGYWTGVGVSLAAPVYDQWTWYRSSESHQSAGTGVMALLDW